MADAAQPDPKLHIITQLDWQREGVHTFEVQRAKLLTLLSQLVRDLPASPQANSALPRQLLFSNQTVVLEDIAALRPKLLASLVIYNAGGRLAIGPWYTEIDHAVTSGEALIRNLLLGRADMQQHGIKPPQIAFMTQHQSHPTQLPQILREFGIETLFLRSSANNAGLPFLWQAPNHSNVLVIPIPDSATPATALAVQQEWQPDGPYVWLNRLADVDAAHLVWKESLLEVPTAQATLADYASTQRAVLPDQYRPVFQGKLCLENEATRTGRFSARRDAKQAIAHSERELLHYAEPLQAIALTHGKLPFSKNQRALLDYSWRLLLQSQAWHIAAGAMNDAVSDELRIRQRRIADNSQLVTNDALQALPGQRKTSSTRTKPEKEIAETVLVVWNLQGHAIQQVVELELILADSHHPAVLVAPSGDEQPFHWDPITKRIGFLADAPPMGYVVYRLTLSRDKTAAYNQPRQIDGQAIGSASSTSLGILNNALEWHYGDHHIHNLLHYHDGGDRGHVWQYQKPTSDLVIQANFVDTPQVEATPTYERLSFRNRMRIAPNLIDGARYRGLRVLDISTTATYYNNLPGIHFQTTFDNNAEDHRLRAHIRTGLNANTSYTVSAFGLQQQPIQSAPSGTQLLRHLIALPNQSNTGGLALLTRGLLEVEPIIEEGQVTLALTLLRSVGWLDPERKVQASSAQMPGDSTVEFMLLPLQDLGPGHLLRLAQQYQAPLRAYQYETAPTHLRHSFLQIDSDQLVLTALKPHLQNKAWVVRLLNPTPRDIGANLTTDQPLSKVTQLTMAETPLGELPFDGNSLNIALEPHQVMTLSLEFA